MTDRKPIVCLDFDGVLHSYVSGWKGADVVPDPPVPGAVRFLAAAVERFEVHVYSSRSGEPGGKGAMFYAILSWSIDELGLDAGRDLARSLVFPSSKPPALVTVDDRVVCFDGTWPSLDDLASFKPWNKLASPVKPDWTRRAAWVAAKYEDLLLARFPHLVEEVDEERGSSPGHLLRMARMLVRREVDGETKACRWLGWLQAMVVAQGWSDLETSKQLNLASGPNGKTES